jgi:phosphoribosylformylglycinamidine cyclo-ligase
MSNLKSSGVNIDLGDQCSKIAYDWAKKSFDNRPAGSGNPLLGVEGSFSNIMDFNGVKVGISSDGIGTKIELAERVGKYDTIGFDLIAMVADDLAANGIETVNLSNILDVDFLDSAIVDELMRGLYEAAKFANITVTGGEIAELGPRINGYGDKMHFNWCSTGIGILPDNVNAIDGKNIKAGDKIIILRSRGFRSNGFSLLRKIMQENFGDEWHNKKYDDTKSWGEVLLTPSLIYTPLIAALMNRGITLKGVAHITGGGVVDNFKRVLKSSEAGGARFDNLYEPHPFMKKVQELGNVEEAQAYRIWNMGNGMMLVVGADEAQTTLDEIKANDFEAQLGGEVIAENKIIFDSKGVNPEHFERDI